MSLPLRAPAPVVLAAVAAALLAPLGSVAAIPAVASAYATIEGPPIYSSTPGLPDDRVYEQVSPADKNGNEAGASTNAFITGAANHYGYATADGDSVLFEGTGPMGESPSGANIDFVATKTPGAGWSTRALLPIGHEGSETLELLHAKLSYLDPSPDLSHAIVESTNEQLASLPTDCGNQLYLAGPDPFVPATWLERPSPGVEHPIENCSSYKWSGAPVGGTPNFSTVYFTFPGTLLPEDAGRAPHAGSGEGVKAWGFYEDHEGVLREAGVLPGGGVDPFGAVPAGSGHGKARFGNEVSEDGARAFFVSPDPASCEQDGGNDNCDVDPPELYLREDGDRTVLVSKDTLLPPAGMLPAAAPDGPSAMLNPTYSEAKPSEAYVFASPDGSQAFFQSEDALTKPAEEASPGAEPKTYDFDVNTGALTYLPGVAGQIVATDKDGSVLAFARPEAGGKPAELALWLAGPAGGTITPVTQLPGPPISGGNSELNLASRYVSEARLSENGLVLVFTTATALSSSFNSGGAEQIYRYDASANTLGCVSCTPAGVTPSGDVSMSSIGPPETYEFKAATIAGMVESRGISANGDRVFFDTPDPLAPQDSNTNAPEVEVRENEFQKQGRDVYEWENGVVYLVSGGMSSRDSYYLDSSENGDDVFFATTEGFVAGDTDGGYDVYDARVPQPGDNPPAAAVPCEGSVCQGPPTVPSSLTAPTKTTFSSPGNLAGGGEPNPPASPVVKSKATPRVAKCKRGFVKKKSRCVRKPKARKSMKGKK